MFELEEENIGHTFNSMVRVRTELSREETQYNKY